MKQFVNKDGTFTVSAYLISQNLETLKCHFHGTIVNYLHLFHKTLFPYNRTQMEICIIKDFTRMSYLREICIDSDTTESFTDLKVDFMEPIKPLRKISLALC